MDAERIISMLHLIIQDVLWCVSKRNIVEYAQNSGEKEKRKTEGGALNKEMLFHTSLSNVSIIFSSWYGASAIKEPNSP